MSKTVAGEYHMRKKLLIGLMSLIMFGLFAGIGQAALVDFDDYKTLNKTLAGVGTWSYFHDMPSNFSDPPDIIVADLTISYQKAFAIGYLSVYGETVPGSPGFVLTWNTKTANFDLPSVLDSWSGGGSQLKVDVTGLGLITLLTSNLHLEYYDNENNNNHTAVPEPGAVILLGTGLLGLVVVGRKKLRK
jgi:PEP-CTERM motif